VYLWALRKNYGENLSATYYYVIVVLTLKFLSSWMKASDRTFTTLALLLKHWGLFFKRVFKKELMKRWVQGNVIFSKYISSSCHFISKLVLLPCSFPFHFTWSAANLYANDHQLHKWQKERPLCDRRTAAVVAGK
jgi:hypothetical protein